MVRKTYMLSFVFCQHRASTCTSVLVPNTEDTPPGPPTATDSLVNRIQFFFPLCHSPVPIPQSPYSNPHPTPMTPSSTPCSEIARSYDTPLYCISPHKCMPHIRHDHLAGIDALHWFSSMSLWDAATLQQYISWTNEVLQNSSPGPRRPKHKLS